MSAFLVILAMFAPPTILRVHHDNRHESWRWEVQETGRVCAVMTHSPLGWVVFTAVTPTPQTFADRAPAEAYGEAACPAVSLTWQDQ